MDKSSPASNFPKPDLHTKKACLFVTCFLYHLNGGSARVWTSTLQPGKIVPAESYCCDLEMMIEKLRKMWAAEENRKGPSCSQNNGRSVSFFESHPAEINAVMHPGSRSPCLFSRPLLNCLSLFPALYANLRQEQFHNLDHLKTALRRFFGYCDLERLSLF